MGHSAGGCLALWAAHQLVSSEKAPLVLAAAPVADLVKAYEMKVSDEGPLAADQWMSPTLVGRIGKDLNRRNTVNLQDVTGDFLFF